MKRWFWFFLLFGCGAVFAQGPSVTQFNLSRLKYSGGGDWYTDPTALPNLLRELHKRVSIDTPAEEKVLTLTDSDLFAYPLMFISGHGTVRFSDEEIRRLREYARRGGTLWADDCFGMDESFRREMAKVFPDHPLTEIPYDHPIFSIFYAFPRGLPKVHEHYGGPPHLLGIYLDGRLAVIYTFNTDIGDGIESEGVHPADSPEIREQAMRMAVNFVLFVLSG
jgi:hypothetical protein